jgi:3-oxoacyl-[acyl-carrier-protein] synthase II
MGLVTPNGVGTEQTWQSLVRGNSGVGPITLFEAGQEYATRIAAEVKNFDPTLYMERKKLKEVSRFIPFSLGSRTSSDARSRSPSAGPRR